MLEHMLDELPGAFFEGLSGGVSLLAEEKHDPGEPELLILGEYCEGALGRSIRLYYGSFLRLFGGCPKSQLRRELRKTLRHEFRHHVEALAGLNDLELEDARELADFRREKAAQAAPKQARRAAWERGLEAGRKFFGGRGGRKG